MDFLTFDNILALISLSALEIVLGIDNVVFIAILVGKLPKEKRGFVRQVGLLLAMGMRILLLLTISWIMKLTDPLFSIAGHGFSGRDLILFAGGMFLIAKATYEIHEKVEGDPEAHNNVKASRSVISTLIQIILLDIIFSLDSVITAVGVAQSVRVMIAAIVLAVLVMMIFARRVSDFIERHPTLKMLALSFLLLIGVVLVADSLGHHIEKGYIYFAMGFSLLVEMLNIRTRTKKPATS